MAAAGDVNGEERAVPEPDARFRAMPGSLYVVATPLGNLRDLTLRALDVLATADVIAAEDTRTTGNLLRHYGIVARTLSLHAHNEDARARGIVERLAEGKSVALVSDAGTPGISDPGARTVRAVRAAGFPVIPIPGPSAVATALSAAGLLADAFLFAGFLPAQAKARRTRLQALAQLPAALVFHEAPHRIRATADDLRAALGEARTLVVARELTKTFETIVSMPLGEASAWFAGDPNRERGEFVLIVDAPLPAADAGAPALDAAALRWLVALLEELPPARAARVVASVTGARRADVYARALALKPETD